MNKAIFSCYDSSLTTSVLQCFIPYKNLYLLFIALSLAYYQSLTFINKNVCKFHCLLIHLRFTCRHVRTLVPFEFENKLSV